LVDCSFDKGALLKDSPDAACEVYGVLYVYIDSSANAILIRQLRLRDQQRDQWTTDTVYLTSYRSPRGGIHLLNSTYLI